MNSREKGKRGERQWRDELRANGYAARRGQQFAGSPDSPDVICDGLPWAHFEVKLAEKLDLYAAMEQARRDCMGENKKQKAESRNSDSARGKVPFVAHRRNYWPWLVTMDAERFYRCLNADMAGRWADEAAERLPGEVCAAFGWMRCEVHEGKRLNIHEAMEEAKTESRKQKAESRNGGRGNYRTTGPQDHGKVAVVAHRRVAAPPAKSGRWLITIEAEAFFRLLRGDFTGGSGGNGGG